MHELSVCQALLVQVGEIALKQRAVGVKSILVAVGPLSGVEPALLAAAFQLARTRDAVAAHAELRFASIPLRVRCVECDAETTCAANRLVCGQCGGYRTQVLSGDELRLMQVELTLDDRQRGPPAMAEQRSQPAM